MHKKKIEKWILLSKHTNKLIIEKNDCYIKKKKNYLKKLIHVKLLLWSAFLLFCHGHNQPCFYHSKYAEIIPRARVPLMARLGKAQGPNGQLEKV